MGGEKIKVEEDEITLKPKMTLLNGITVIVGSIIGSGIFVSPTGVLTHTGSVNMSLIVWVLSGIYSMVRKCVKILRRCYFHVLFTIGEGKFASNRIFVVLHVSHYELERFNLEETPVNIHLRYGEWRSVSVAAIVRSL